VGLEGGPGNIMRPGRGEFISLQKSPRDSPTLDGKGRGERWRGEGGPPLGGRTGVEVRGGGSCNGS